jgi:hypothetical protein
MRLMFNWIHADQDRGAVTDVETDIYAMWFDVSLLNASVGWVREISGLS